MKMEVLETFIQDNMSDAIIEQSDDGALIIHTQMRVAEKDDGLYIVPMNDPINNNVIDLFTHPKFLAAH